MVFSAPNTNMEPTRMFFSLTKRFAPETRDHIDGIQRPEYKYGANPDVFLFDKAV